MTLNNDIAVVLLLNLHKDPDSCWSSQCHSSVEGGDCCHLALLTRGTIISEQYQLPLLWRHSGHAYDHIVPWPVEKREQETCDPAGALNRLPAIASYVPNTTKPSATEDLVIFYQKFTRGALISIRDWAPQFKYLLKHYCVHLSCWKTKRINTFYTFIENITTSLSSVFHNRFDFLCPLTSLWLPPRSPQLSTVRIDLRRTWDVSTIYSSRLCRTSCEVDIGHLGKPEEHFTLCVD